MDSRLAVLKIKEPILFIVGKTAVEVEHLAVYILPKIKHLAFYTVQYSKHLFVHINQSNPSYNDPMLESVDIRQIYDKFPESQGGLRDLFENGPKDAFFLVKFWVGIKILFLCSFVT